MLREDVEQVKRIVDEAISAFGEGVLEGLKKGLEKDFSSLREEIILEVDGRVMARAVAAESKLAADKPAAKKESK